MASWISSANKFYIPPQTFTKVPSTDEYVTRTNMFYHAGTDRLLTVGHPFFKIINGTKVNVPKVSPNQYRVFRVRFPDPNKFAFPDKTFFDPDTERLVWACRGIEISRGQPLGVPITGHPLLNRAEDVENGGTYKGSSYADEKDHRQNIAMDPKQTQMFIIGCTPATGEFWTKAETCVEQPHEAGDGPAIELKHTIIEDGAMCDIGFGAMDFSALQVSRTEVPLDIINSICIYPDYIRMSKEKYGDSMFFYARREQLYGRHFFSRDGKVGKEKVPDAYIRKAVDGQAQATLGNSTYYVTPSGSLVSSDSQLLNRPYWIQRAQGKNNGIAWNNQLFVTVMDNTRGTVMTITSAAANPGPNEDANYKNTDFDVFMRHVEEYELEFIMQLCKVKLTTENVAFINQMDPNIIEGWELALTAPQASGLEDTYRYLESLATKCPPKPTPDENKDPWSDYTFWDVDLTERMSDDLDMFALGRKFLFQSGFAASRPRSIRTTNRTRAIKRKRK